MKTPEDPWFRSGTVGWVLLGAGILIWDVAAPETLSDAFRRVRQQPYGNAITAGAWAVLTLHLFGKLPDKADPFHVITIIRARNNA